jgi:S1-C subfamily serine protease
LYVAVASCLAGTCVFPATAQDSVTHRPSVLEQFETELQAVVQSVKPSVVTIRATFSAETQEGTASGRNSAMSVGSGLLLDSIGLIMTSSRVVSGADDFWVETSDERLYQAALLGSSEDVAVLQIKGFGFKPAPFGDAIDLGVGSFVAALGNSYGFSCGVSWGQVNGFRPDGTIQLALGVSPGNTGGALVNSRGLVVGLVKAKVSEPFYLDPLHTQAQFGEEKIPLTVPGRRLELPTSPVSLAIPIQAALRAARRIIESGTESRAYVGIYVEDLAGWYVAHFKTSDGVLVTGVVGQTPAERSGLQQADVITSVDRKSVSSVRQFRQIVSQASPGQRLQFDLIRGGNPLKLVVEAGRAETPHLGETDRNQTPFATRSERTKTNSEVSPPMYAAANQSVLEQLDVAASSPAPSGEDTGRSDVSERIEAMQRVIDSLQKELLLIKREARE